MNVKNINAIKIKEKHNFSSKIKDNKKTNLKKNYNNNSIVNTKKNMNSKISFKLQTCENHCFIGSIKDNSILEESVMYGMNEGVIANKPYQRNFNVNKNKDLFIQEFIFATKELNDELQKNLNFNNNLNLSYDDNDNNVSVINFKANDLNNHCKNDSNLNKNVTKKLFKKLTKNFKINNNELKPKNNDLNKLFCVNNDNEAQIISDDDTSNGSNSFKNIKNTDNIGNSKFSFANNNKFDRTNRSKSLLHIPTFVSEINANNTTSNFYNSIRSKIMLINSKNKFNVNKRESINLTTTSFKMSKENCSKFKKNLNYNNNKNNTQSNDINKKLSSSINSSNCSDKSNNKSNNKNDKCDKLLSEVSDTSQETSSEYSCSSNSKSIYEVIKNNKEDINVEINCINKQSINDQNISIKNSSEHPELKHKSSKNITNSKSLSKNNVNIYVKKTTVSSTMNLLNLDYNNNSNKKIKTEAYMEDKERINYNDSDSISKRNSNNKNNNNKNSNNNSKKYEVSYNIILLL